MGFLTNLNPLNWEVFGGGSPTTKPGSLDEAYQAGTSYADDEEMPTGALEDLKALGFSGGKNLETLMDVIKGKGKPMNDRAMTMEKMIAITASLPRTSATRKKLTGVIIDGLWNSLQHPPLSYLGPKFQYRTPDGSYNNPLQPNLGKAGSPYAKTVKKLKYMKGTPPDPGLLFDLLMARSPETFKENPAGISSMLFYHATIIIHDVFLTNRFDNTISDTSSYLDLAPLYGSSLEDQLKVRTMSNGLLKPDTFHEKRLIGQPPGVNCILVMYSRFHNYAADMLLKINEYGRFTLPQTTTDEDKKKALTKQDEDLFQTARLITNGLYIQICLHDYLRGLTNAHHSTTDWTLDPRIDVDRMFDAEGVPKGVGNQVSAEFNLLYRFHSVISLRDEKWTEEFLQTLFPGLDKPLDQLSPHEFVMGLYRYEKSIPEDPSIREFGGIKRGTNGKFSDGDLVKILTESMEDPAGLFGPRMVPKALKIIEIAGILTARKWQLASLNEMRSTFGLKTHDTFEDLNPDPEIAGLLRKIYQDPDMVEMYPGMFLEDAKPRMDPGCGGCPPYTVGRAVFSDAVTLVRSDRFLTLDYTVSTLTNWGMEEVKRDLKVLGGSMFYKLFQRAIPGWYPYNSLHIMQPMFTRKMNEEIAKEFNTIEKYTLAGPSPPSPPRVVMNKDVIRPILQDKENFKVVWGKNFKEMSGNKHGYDKFMLGGDTPAHAAQREMMMTIAYSKTPITKLVTDATLQYAEQYLKEAAMTLTKDLYQVDVLRDVAIPTLTRVLSDLFCLDLRTADHPKGSLNIAEMYRYMMDVRIWGFSDLDVAMSWKRRMWAEEAAAVLTKSTANSITAALIGRLPGLKNGDPKKNLRAFGQDMVKKLSDKGQTKAQINDLMWLTPVGGVGVVVGLVADCLTYFLDPANATTWEQLQKLAASSDESSIPEIRKYVREAQRLTSSQRDVRFCVADTKVGTEEFKKGDKVILMLGIAGKAPNVPDAKSFKLDRSDDDYMHFGYGPHECFGKEIALTTATAMLKVLGSLKGLRPAPGDMGILKSVMVGGIEKYYLNDSWSYLTSDPSTWTLHFSGYGQGAYQPPKVSEQEGRNLETLFNALKKDAGKL